MASFWEFGVSSFAKNLPNEIQCSKSKFPKTCQRRAWGISIKRLGKKTCYFGKSKFPKTCHFRKFFCQIRVVKNDTRHTKIKIHNERTTSRMMMGIHAGTKLIMTAGYIYTGMGGEGGLTFFACHTWALDIGPFWRRSNRCLLLLVRLSYLVRTSTYQTLFFFFSVITFLLSSRFYGQAVGSRVVWCLHFHRAITGGA